MEVDKYGNAICVVLTLLLVLAGCFWQHMEKQGERVRAAVAKCTAQAEIELDLREKELIAAKLRVAELEAELCKRDAALAAAGEEAAAVQAETEEVQRRLCAEFAERQAELETRLQCQSAELRRQLARNTSVLQSRRKLRPGDGDDDYSEPSNVEGEYQAVVESNPAVAEELQLEVDGSEVASAGSRASSIYAAHPRGRLGLWELQMQSFHTAYWRVRTLTPQGAPQRAASIRCASC
ncbi:unnamed protein product [Symbiodinium sp. CCMP2592]|nr:unnamed protein product [Symbiodinium sp. CCMP2592]